MSTINAINTIERRVDLLSKQLKSSYRNSEPDSSSSIEAVRVDVADVKKSLDELRMSQASMFKKERMVTESVVLQKLDGKIDQAIASHLDSALPDKLDSAIAEKIDAIVAKRVENAAGRIAQSTTLMVNTLKTDTFSRVSKVDTIIADIERRLAKCPGGGSSGMDDFKQEFKQESTDAGDVDNDDGLEDAPSLETGNFAIQQQASNTGVELVPARPPAGKRARAKKMVDA